MRIFNRKHPATKRSIAPKYEGKDFLLFENKGNPYESIYIRASVKHHMLTVNDSECGHAPDGGWSEKIIRFDEKNTEEVLRFLSESRTDPFTSLKGMLDEDRRTKAFTQECKSRNIEFTIGYAICSVTSTACCQKCKLSNPACIVSCEDDVL